MPSDVTFSRSEKSPVLLAAEGAMRVYALECKELGIPYVYDPSQQIVRLSDEDLELLRPFFLVTMKPTMYVANVDEKGFKDNPLLADASVKRFRGGWWTPLTRAR